MSILAQIEILTQAVQAAQNKVNTTRAEYDRQLAWERELDRQRLYHIGNNDTYNAGIVSEQLHTVRGEREAAGYAWEDAKDELDAALEKLNTAKANLTAAEQEALTAQLNATIAQSNAAIAAAESNQKIAEASFIAQNTKYFIIGAVVLVIAIAAFIYFKKGKTALKA